MKIPDGLFVFVGGCCGTLTRYLLSLVWPDHSGSWPTTILLINFLGCLALGWLSRFLALLGPDEGWHRIARLGIGTGMIGGFTTYSTFITQSIGLVRVGHLSIAIGYIVASLIGGTVFAWLGITLATKTTRQVVSQ